MRGGHSASAGRLFARGLAKLDACPRLLAGRPLADFTGGVRAWAQALAGGTPPPDRAPIPRLGPPERREKPGP